VDAGVWHVGWAATGDEEARAALAAEVLGVWAGPQPAATATTTTKSAARRMSTSTRRGAASYETASAFFTPFGPGHFG
jgi:hypothetical protein